MNTYFKSTDEQGSLMKKYLQYESYKSKVSLDRTKQGGWCFTPATILYIYISRKGSHPCKQMPHAEEQRSRDKR